MKTTQVDLLRHGHCEGGRIFRGHCDSPLSQLGTEQMQRALSSHALSSPSPLENIEAGQSCWDIIISSPSKRCQSFAQQLSEQLTTPLLIAPELKEIFFGDWEGLEIDVVNRDHSQQLANFWREPQHFPPPNGETMAHFFQRVNRYWQQMLVQQQGKRCLVVTHGGSIRCILASILGMPLSPLSRLSVPHACLSRISVFHQDGSDDWPQLTFHRPLPDTQLQH
jgi:broad specificity phosphatase PhoE